MPDIIDVILRQVDKQIADRTKEVVETDPELVRLRAGREALVPHRAPRRRGRPPKEPVAA